MRPSSESAHLPRGRGSWRDAVASLENPQYRWLYLSNLAFFLAMGGQGIVRGWLAFELTDSELALGLVSFAVALPMLFISPIGGAIADRRERRNLIVGGQACVVASEAVILGLLIYDRLEFWHLLVAAAGMGCVFPFIMPARQAIVVNVVGKSGLSNAMALSMAGMNATRVIGPAAAGFLIGPLGVTGTYAAGLVLYLIALLCLTRVQRAEPEGNPREVSIVGNMIDGVRYVADQRLVLVLLFFGLVPMFLAMPFQTLLVVFADEIWAVGPQGLGLLSGAAGIGGVVGSIFLAAFESRRRLRMMMASMLGFGSFLLLFALSPWFLLGLPLLFLANIFASIYGTLNNTAIQLLIPDHVRGRISSFLMMSFSLPLLGTLPVSALAEAYGAPLAVGCSALLAMAVAVIFYLASPALRGMDESVRKAMLE
jgi:MFS family permease